MNDPVSISSGAIVAGVIEMKIPVSEAYQRLSLIVSGCSNEAALVGRKHILNALNGYISAKFTSSDIEDWANFIEGREDIEIEDEGLFDLSELMHELANPSLTEPLSLERARHLVLQLTSP